MKLNAATKVGALVLVVVLAAPAVSRWATATVSVPFERVRLATMTRGNLVRDVSVQGRVVAAVRPTLYATGRRIQPLDGTHPLGMRFSTREEISDYLDELIETCGDGFKIIRTWTVLDWCTNNVILSNDLGEDNIQVIKVVDSTPPTVRLERSGATWVAVVSDAGGLQQVDQSEQLVLPLDERREHEGFTSRKSRTALGPG